MRYIEYVYLIGSICIGVFIALNYRHMTTMNVVFSGLGAGIAAFMYSIRRSQRLLLERAEQEELDKLEKEAGEDD